MNLFDRNHYSQMSPSPPTQKKQSSKSTHSSSTATMFNPRPFFRPIRGNGRELPSTVATDRLETCNGERQTIYDNRRTTTSSNSIWNSSYHVSDTNASASSTSFGQYFDDEPDVNISGNTVHQSNRYNHNEYQNNNCVGFLKNSDGQTQQTVATKNDSNFRHDQQTIFCQNTSANEMELDNSYHHDKSMSETRNNIMNHQMQENYQKPRSSKAISLPEYHIPRTQSEQQLSEDTAAAEWRDVCMFYRLVGGIRERQIRRLRRDPFTSNQINNNNSEGEGEIYPYDKSDRIIEQSIVNIVRHRQQDLSRLDEDMDEDVSYSTEKHELDSSTHSSQQQCASNGSYYFEQGNNVYSSNTNNGGLATAALAQSQKQQHFIPTAPSIVEPDDDCVFNMDL